MVINYITDTESDARQWLEKAVKRSDVFHSGKIDRLKNPHCNTAWSMETVFSEHNYDKLCKNFSVTAKIKT